MQTKNEVRDYAARAESGLRANGHYYMPNDEPGLAYAVYEQLCRNFPNAHIDMDKPKFGGEATFQSDDFLGTKKVNK